MAEVVDKANIVWRDFEEPNNPASGARDPDKTEIREFAEVIEEKITETFDALSDLVDEAVALAESVVSLGAPTWTALAAITGTRQSQVGRSTEESETHTDPVVGGSKPNGGDFLWNMSPPGWLYWKPLQSNAIASIPTALAGTNNTDTITALSLKAANDARLEIDAAPSIQRTKIGSTTVNVQTDDGKFYFPGMDGMSVQDLAALIGRSQDRRNLRGGLDVNATLIDLLTDDGRYYLPGLQSSVQDKIAQIERRISRLTSRNTVVHAYDCGATGEIGQDAYGPMQRAIDSLGQNGGGTVLVGPGAYRLSTSLTPASGVSIKGAGASTVFYPCNLDAAFKRIGANSSDYLTDCVFEDFQVDGQYHTLNGGAYTASMKAFFIQFYKRCFFNRIRAVNTGATAFGSDFGYDSAYTCCVAENAGRLASVGDGGASGFGYGSGGSLSEPVMFLGNVARGCKNYGFFGEAQRLVTSPYASRNVVLMGNLSEGNYYGFGDCGLDGVRLVDNQLVDNISHAINMDTGTLPPVSGHPMPGARGLIAHNQMLRNGGAMLKYDGSVIAGGGGYRVLDNIAEDNGAGVLLDFGSNTVGGFRFRGNEFWRTGGPAFSLVRGTLYNSDFEDTRVFDGTGNVFNFAAGTTFSLGSIRRTVMRDLRGTPLMTNGLGGSGTLIDIDIDGNEARYLTGAFDALSGTKTRVTYGRNI